MVVMAAVFALVVAACGDDDSADNGASADNGNSSGNPEATFDPDETIPVTVGDVPGLSSECEALANLALAIGRAFTGGVEEVPAGIVEDLPSEMRADGEIVLEALTEYSRRLEEAGIDLSGGVFSLAEDQIEAYSDITEEVFDEELEDAYERIGEAAAVSDCIPGPG
jgi:hypothetical protein